MVDEKNKKREFKFRAWDSIRKEMISWTLLGAMNGIFLNDAKENITQFIGLLDKNKKEIFVGDIVRLSNMENLEDTTGIVKVGKHFADDTCGDGWGGGYAYGYYVESFKKLSNGQIRETSLLNRFNEESIEIIGNKFENPELLEEGK